MNKGFTYLSDVRLISTETIDKFRLGFCDEHGHVEFKRSGLAEERPELQTLCLEPRFRDSVLFPIYSLYDKLIGVSGRILGDTDKMKYINTVYPKGKHLYGLSVTWYDCLKKKKVYVVEGNVDAIMMYQSGIHNVVGMLGSTLGITQLTMLSRFVDHVVFVPDGDQAGEAFIKRMLVGKPRRRGLVTKYPNLGLSFSIVRLPKDSDPDTFLKKNTVEEFYKLEEPVSFDSYEHCKKAIGGLIEE